MRPIAASRNELRYPLDVLLGTKAQIRVLRLLAESARPMSPSEIQSHTGVSLPGTLKVLDRLVTAGFLDTLGSERSKLYSLSLKNRLSESLTLLFEAERTWHESVVNALRTIFSTLTNPVDSAWVVLDDYCLGDPLRIGFLTGTKHLATTRNEVRDRIGGAERDFNLSTELSGMTPADMQGIEPENIVLLAGYSPFERSSPSNGAASHSTLDIRSLKRARRLARMIERDPTIVSRAVRHVNLTIGDQPESRRTDLKEWQQILNTHSQRQLLDFLVDPGERATRLRQSSPFLAVLSPEEKSLLRNDSESDDD